ncbi:uncharacterized protein DMAD_06926 [Drosophila madeirensis]|uniref:Uncharacterized protein n=1 Tax=Drosophila madeirensis TaxID=30013 RepID=A0AAU9FTI7_DROMD
MMRATLLATQIGGIKRALFAGRQVMATDYSTLVMLPLKGFDGAPFRGCVPVYRLCSGGGGDGDKNKKSPTGFAMPAIGTDLGATTPPGGASKLGETLTLAGVKPIVDDAQGKDNEENRLSRLKNMSKGYDGAKDKGNEEGKAYQMKQKGKAEECYGKSKIPVPEAKPISREGSIEEAAERISKQLGELVDKLPNKQQTEKYFFRTVAFFYDLSFLAVTWTIHLVEKNIFANPTVKAYWKKFHDKMEQSKKDKN